MIIRKAIAFPTDANRNPMFVSLNNFTIDQLESAKSVANVLFIISTFIVWLGVCLEKETFSKPIQDRGWELLVIFLGFETLLSGILWQIDSTVSMRQKTEILQLEAQIAPRRLKSEEKDKLSKIFSKFPQGTVRISSYALDLESAALGEQILSAINWAATISPLDRRMTVSTLGAIAFGVHVTGHNDQLIDDLVSAFTSFGILSSKIEPPAPTMTMRAGDLDDIDVDATVFVGVKPIAE